MRKPAASLDGEVGQRSLAELFRERAAADPDRPAIEDGERRLTYRELDAASAGIAAGLIEAGVREEEPVAICLTRSWKAVASYLGALRAGAAYLPVNPAHPSLRQAQLVELAGARLALTERGNERGLPPEVMRLDAERLAVGSGAEFSCASGGDRLAYVLFTSGSTGRPKGVEVTHRNLVNLICSGADVVPCPEDRVLHVVPLDFDVSGLEIWGALLNGACLVIAPQGRPDPAELGRLIAERDVTFTAASTGVFHELVRLAMPDLGGLRVATPGGDVLSPAAVRALREAHPQVRVINGYGPTEVTIVACSYEVEEPEDGPVPIGRPLPGSLFYVLDEDGRPVDHAESGEIWIGGACVARGYRGDPERTNDRFRPNPFAEGSIYRTGDRGRWRGDGELMFLGRLDRQVKISGQRVELGEVESVLAEHPEVRSAAVLADESVPGHKRLLAHFEAGPDAPSQAELRVFLGERLPRFMVPSTFVSHATLPMTDRGKVDREVLASGGAARPTKNAASTSNETVELVRRTMAELLELPSVGPDENLFDAGGDSLLAIALLGLLREHTGIDLSVDAVFESPTPAALADRLELAPRPDHPRPSLSPGAPASTAPLSFAQRRAWLFAQMNPSSIAYQFASLFRFRGELDRDAMAGAMGELIARHEILRTSFVQRGDAPLQVIHHQVEVPLEEVDLRGATHGAEAREIRDRVRTRIDTGDAPLVRWTLLRLQHEEWALVHVEHHLIHDGWSFAVLVGELSELYSARVERRATTLPPSDVQFRDYTVWERELAATDSAAEQLAYWKRTLEPDAPLIELPTDRARPARESFSGSSIRRRMEAPEATALAAVGRAEGATLFMASFAALAVLLGRYADQDDLQIGSGVANRTESASRRVLGMVVNTVVMRVDLRGDPTVAELMRRVRRVALEAYANADAPFDAVVDALAPQRQLGRSPLINVLYSFHDSPRPHEHWEGVEATLVQTLPNGTAKADLNVIGIDDQDDGMTFVWEHSDLFEDATADRLAGEHLDLMAQFARRPDARLSELELPREPATGRKIDEQHVLRGPATDYERDDTVVDVFRDRVAEGRDVVALDLEGVKLTYAELDARSDRIARRLVALGVKPGARIGVLLRRSLDAYMALLAVLKAGAAYVALDPDWPGARFESLAADAGLGVIITERSLSRRLPVGVVPLVVEDPGPEADLELPGSIDPESAAYVAYTSGSTGDPKGVEVPHRAIVRLVRGQDWVRLGPDETLLAAAPIAFDASTFEIWGALLNGARLAIFPPEPPTPGAIDEVVRRQRVTTLWLTAGLFHHFVDLELDALRAVDQLIAGGDVLSPTHVRRALELMRPDAVLINGYGPTEATTFSCVHPLQGGGSMEGGVVPIGRPLANTHVVVVGDDGRSLPSGSVGELWIGGDGVANGYLGDADLTRERFVADPVSGGQFYRSGDRVRVNDKGELEFVGRRDRQLKIRGYRVEPGEVEAALGSHSGVAEVIVEAEADAEGQAQLVAYYVGRDEVDWRTLRAWLGARLPAALVPSQWHELSELPLTANGKVDRALLPQLASPGRRARPRRGGGDSLEDRLCGIWRSVLGVDTVDPHDDFFELGGHSLLAVSLFGEIERQLGVELPLALLFEAPTPAALAGSIRAGGWQENWEPLVALRIEGRRPPFFCVTAGDGNAVGFGALARRLDEQQPFYALQPPGLDGLSRFPTSVEVMADRYLREVRRVAPEGPYLLGGRCLGSKVALEMAQRLRGDGERVALLAILDDLEGPAGMDLTLSGGIAYGEVLSRLRERGRADGVDLGDIYGPDRGQALLAYAREPVVGDVPRLLEQVWLERPELRTAFPDIANGDGARLIDWAWEYGRDQFDLPEALLPPPSIPGLVKRRQSPRREGHRPREWASALAELIDVAARGRLPRARERRDARLRRITRLANERYRAAPYPGRITHLASAERADQLTARRWYDIAQGGVEEVTVSASHRSMLRVPGVAELAARLDECIEEALR